MKSLLNLPFELQLEILEYLDSPANLQAAVNTCSSLRQIKLSNRWKMLEDRVYMNETGKVISAELVGLWKIREIKSQERLKELMTEITRSKQTSVFYVKPEDVSLRQLSAIRRVLQWFARRYLNHHLRLQQNLLRGKRFRCEPIPLKSPQEVENAVCMMWFWLEASSSLNKASPMTLARSRFYTALRDTYGSAVSHIRLETSVYQFFRTELDVVTREHRKDSNIRSLEHLAFRGRTYDSGLFAHCALPYRLFKALGLDGTKIFFQLPRVEQLKQMKTYYDPDVMRAGQLSTGFNIGILQEFVAEVSLLERQKRTMTHLDFECQLQ